VVKKQLNYKLNGIMKTEDNLHKDIKRVAVALERLVKLLTKLIKDNA
jgi:hypothetical protein